MRRWKGWRKVCKSWKGIAVRQKPCQRPVNGHHGCWIIDAVCSVSFLEDRWSMRCCAPEAYCKTPSLWWISMSVAEARGRTVSKPLFTKQLRCVYRRWRRSCFSKLPLRRGNAWRWQRCTLGPWNRVQLRSGILKSEGERCKWRRKWAWTAKYKKSRKTAIANHWWSFDVASVYFLEAQGLEFGVKLL